MTYDETKHTRGGNPANTGEYSAKANSDPGDVLGSHGGDLRTYALEVGRGRFGSAESFVDGATHLADELQDHYAIDAAVDAAAGHRHVVVSPGPHECSCGVVVGNLRGHRVHVQRASIEALLAAAVNGPGDIWWHGSDDSPDLGAGVPDCPGHPESVQDISRVACRGAVVSVQYSREPRT